MGWKEHKAKWSNCQACDLCEGRSNVVLARGTLPCDVLFVGEAPGDSEDVVGKPFVGPAGKLLDEIIQEAGFSQRRISCAFTNLVACVPKWDGDKREPTPEEIEACSGRLMALYNLATPSILVQVGKLSEKYALMFSDFDYDVIKISITHPAAIIRAPLASRSLAIQRCIVTLREALDDLVPF